MNVTALVDESDGAVVERYRYDPYGKVSVRHGVRDAAGNNTSEDEWDERTGDTFDNAILYCGYYFDDESGLYHVRHRSYHPTLGRWMQRDPIGYADGTNSYGYVGDAPVHFADPHGLWRRVGKNVWEAERDGESLTDLATMDGVNDSADSWVCIKPLPQGLSADVQAKMRDYYKNEEAPDCGRYDTGNLTDSWPSGGEVAFSFFDKGDVTGKRFHDTFPKIPSFSRADLASAANKGSTPLHKVLLGGHSQKGLTYLTSKERGGKRFGVSEILGGNLDQGTYNDAVDGKFPPICWFRHDATVVLLGCHTAAAAREWARNVLRRGAKARGSVAYLNWPSTPPLEPFFSYDPNTERRRAPDQDSEKYDAPKWWLWFEGMR